LIPGVRLVLLGKQGSGKGTQAVRLARHYVVHHVSTGDMFRASVRAGTTFGRKAQEYMDAGELVPDEITIGIVKERLEQAGTKRRGFVLDGFPRNVFQAEALSSFLAPQDIHLAIDLEVPTEIVLKRLAARRVCSSCGTNYSVDVPPLDGWTCDVCGGDVVQRADDTESAIRRRLEIYDTNTAPLIAWYKEAERLEVVDGDGPADEVTTRLIDTVDRRREVSV
jgi:adenylate kinase